MKKYFMFYLVLIAFLLLSGTIHSQSVILYDNIRTGADTTLVLNVINPDDMNYPVTDIVYHLPAILSVQGPNVIPANGVATFSMTVSLSQNVDYKDLLVIQSDAKDFGYLLELKGIFGDFYDTFTRNQWDESLKQALKNYLAVQETLTYSGARDYMFTVVDNVNDSVECVYTGRKIYLDHNSTTPRSDAYDQNINTEHTFPQGLFNKELPMRSDLYHLFPSDVTANSKRGSYPFGVVVSNIQYENGGSRLGDDANGNIVFEPRDVHKGNVARAMFYFVTRYQNYSNFLDTQESVLRQWNAQDPVDTREMTRNDRIAVKQGKRNPFIDHPELVDRIINFSHTQNRTWNPNLIASRDTLWVTPEDTVIVYLFNQDRGDLIIQSVASNDMNVIIASDTLPKTLTYGEVDSLVVVLQNGLQSGQAELSISSNDPDEPVHTILLIDATTGIQENSTEMDEIVRIFPNPFNSYFQIRLDQGTGIQSVEIYDILGRKIYQRIFGQNSRRMKVIPGMAQQPSGIYFLKIHTRNHTFTKKLIYLR
jgi:hypothetical protein